MICSSDSHVAIEDEEVLLRCSLSYPKLVQTECNGHRKAEGFCLAIAEVQPILSKDNQKG